MTCHAQYDRPSNGIGYSRDSGVQNWYGSSMTVRDQPVAGYDLYYSTQVNRHVKGRPFFEAWKDDAK